MYLNELQNRKPTAGIALGISFILTALIAPGVVFAGTQNIASIASNLTANFANLAQLITASAYLGGLGFAVGAILKFRQHKESPQQVPIGTPIAMLIVAAAMIFLPTILGITGQSLFGATGTAGGATGVVPFS